MFRPRGRDRRRGGAASFFPGATLDMNFAQSWYLGATPSQFAASLRGSDGYADDGAGVWSVFSSNVPRITNRGLLVEEARTNSIRNNSMQGAVVGVVGAGGAAPTNWSLGSAVAGTTREIIGVGTDQGVDYIDVKISGTASATGSQSFFFDGYASSTAAGTVGQTWTGSCFVKLISNTGAALVNTTAIDEFSGVGAYLTGAQVGQTAAVTGRFQRLTQTRTLTDASTARTTFDYRITITNGQTYDLVIRIGWPQLELGAFVTSPIRTTSAAITRAADAVSLTGANFTSWYGSPVAATLFAEYTFSSAAPNNAGTQTILMINDGTINNRLQILRLATGAALNSRIVSGGAAANPADISGHGPATTYKAAVAAAVGANQGIACLNSTLSTASTPAAMPVAPTVLGIGINHVNLEQLNGYIRRIAYFPSRLANAELQAITT